MITMSSRHIGTNPEAWRDPNHLDWELFTEHMITYKNEPKYNHHTLVECTSWSIEDEVRNEPTTQRAGLAANQPIAGAQQVTSEHVVQEAEVCEVGDTPVVEEHSYGEHVDWGVDQYGEVTVNGEDQNKLELPMEEEDLTQFESEREAKGSVAQSLDERHESRDTQAIEFIKVNYV